MSQASMGTSKPLGYYGCDTSLPAMQTLQAAYGSNLEKMRTEVTGAAMGVLTEILSQEESVKMQPQEFVNLSFLLERLHKQGGREQTIALLKAIVESL